MRRYGFLRFSKKHDRGLTPRGAAPESFMASKSTLLTDWCFIDYVQSMLSYASTLIAGCFIKLFWCSNSRNSQKFKNGWRPIWLEPSDVWLVSLRSKYMFVFPFTTYFFKKSTRNVFKVTHFDERMCQTFNIYDGLLFSDAAWKYFFSEKKEKTDFPVKKFLFRASEYIQFLRSVFL